MLGVTPQASGTHSNLMPSNRGIRVRIVHTHLEPNILVNTVYAKFV